MYFCDSSFSYDLSKGTFQQYKITAALRRVGIDNISIDLSFLSPLLSISEALISTLFVLVRALYLQIKITFVRHRSYYGKHFLASLTFAPFRLMGLLETIRPLSVSTLKIPFIKNEYHENEVDILSAISLIDIFYSLFAAWSTIWVLYKKYRHRDPLFRSISSFEFYLTCCFVSSNNNNNRFVYYNTYDRWAFLMSNTKEATFIQHGKLMDSLSFIKVGTPYIAYYLSKRQKNTLEKVLFSSSPNIVRYRNPISFTNNEILLHNGKKNILLVCWSNNIKKEWEICRIIYNNYNIYIKPHPGDKDNIEYNKMADHFNCIIVPKTGYPQVDVVISYDSTLADEYEDVNIRVIRYDLLNNLSEIVNYL